MAFYFYEQLVKKIENNPDTWGSDQYKRSHPEVLTAIKRKKELREKVDVNFNSAFMLSCCIDVVVACSQC